MKRLRAAIAGWNALSIRSGLESFYAKRDPLFDESVDLPANIPKSVSLYEAEDAIKNAEMKLWNHITNDHGGSWYDRGCKDRRQHVDIKDMLGFWIRNINRLKKELPPVTNPLWLRGQNPNVTIRMERKLVPSSHSEYLMRLVLLFSSNAETLLQDIEKTVIFPTSFAFLTTPLLPIMKKEGTLFWSALTLLKGEGMRIIRADEELEKESQKWFNKEMVLWE